MKYFMLVLLYTIIAVVTHFYVLTDHLHIKFGAAGFGGAVVLAYSTVAWFFAILIFVMSNKAAENEDKSSILYCTILMPVLAAVFTTMALLISTSVIGEVQKETIIKFAAVASVIGMIEGLIFGVVLNEA